MILLKNKKIKRKKCPEWEGIKWKERLLIFLLSLIDISKRKKCAEIVKTKIMLPDINVRTVNYPFSLCNNSYKVGNFWILMIKELKFQLNIIRK